MRHKKSTLAGPGLFKIAPNSKFNKRCGLHVPRRTDNAIKRSKRRSCEAPRVVKIAQTGVGSRCKQIIRGSHDPGRGDSAKVYDGG
jgi:hypothetical protein